MKNNFLFITVYPTQGRVTAEWLWETMLCDY